MQAEFVDLELRLGDRRLRLLDGLARKVELSAKVGLLAFDAELLGSGHQALLDHRFDQRRFLVADGEALGQAIGIGGCLVQLLLALIETRFEHRQLHLEVLAARDQQLLFVVADLRRDLLDFRWTGKRPLDTAALLILQPRDARL